MADKKYTTHCIFISSSSIVHFSRKRSPVHFLTKTLDSFLILIQKPKERRERERNKKKKERERDREKDKRKGEEEEVNAQS